MGFGNLDRRIDLQTGVEAVADNGSRTVSWSSFQECWAGLDYGKKGVGDEDYEADQLTASNVIRFKIRYLPGVNEKMRLAYGDVDYNVCSTPIGPAAVLLHGDYGDISEVFTIGMKIVLNGGASDGDVHTLLSGGFYPGGVCLGTYFGITPNAGSEDYTSITLLNCIYYDILHISEVDRQRYLIIKAEKKD